ncbi:hypothetical protein FO488_01005 [Geobacter sp. FeAm09]|uniref:sulfatase-like hydrolase/transferase n=1 Tax=Geobacter sp. FeAm09 TaxID=2597769 RepID=UPI0011EEE637|nr:sulfatase-like hydrolase/transferase [Geobacter sp. FeAm09]QEM66875.1 hypothetical protein FO488_01005 [Geobacter sp. FeAm09]
MSYFFRYILVPNLIFGIFSAIATSSRALINLDYCLVGLCSPIIGRYWAAAMYLVFFILDLLAAFAPTYHLRPMIILTIFRELSAFKPAALALLLVLVVAPLLGMWYLTFKRETASPPKASFRGRSVLVIVPICFILLDIMNGSNGLVRWGDVTHFSYNIAGSALVKVSRDVKATLTRQKIPPKKLGQMEYATSGVHADLIADTLKPQHIVLVIVESWGLSSDPALNQALVAPLIDPKLSSRYQVRHTTIPFHGATVSAELRELYARQASDPDDVLSESSLPALLAAKSYETISLHGFMSMFFGRNEWYPQAGFRSSLFIDDIDKLLPSHERCGSANFRGICDDKMPSLIKQLLISSEGATPTVPKFIYWLTLNSHYPYAVPDHPSSFACQSFDLSSRYQDVCNLSGTLYSTFSALGSLIADPDIPPTRFIIVGDHSPPFLMRSKEGLYNRQFVPMVEIIPKVLESKR